MPNRALRRFGVYLLPDGTEVVATPETDGCYLYPLAEWETARRGQPAYVVYPSGLIRRDGKLTGWHSKDLKDTSRTIDSRLGR